MEASLLLFPPTSEGVHQLRRLHVVQVGGPIPRRRHHLFAPHQPIGGDHHALVAAQRRGGHAHRGTIVRPFRLAVGLVFVREVHVVLAGGLLLRRGGREVMSETAAVVGAASQTPTGRCGLR